MSSDLKTPTQSFISDVHKVIAAAVKKTAVYDRWIPASGAKLPCVTIIPVRGPVHVEVGIGQVLGEGVVGVYLPLRVQIDVWARSVKTVRKLADEVGYALWSHRGSFGDLQKGIKILGPGWVSPGRGLSEKVYRQMLMAEAVYGMTKTIT